MLREAWARESAGSKSDRSEPRSLPSGAASRSDGSNKNRSVRPRALSVTPLYAGLPPAAQTAAFAPAPRHARKVVVASNVAETSVTIEGVAYVVDCLFAKKKNYDAARSAETLMAAPVSRAAANQRAGRAGRARPGCVSGSARSLISRVCQNRRRRRWCARTSRASCCSSSTWA